MPSSQAKPVLGICYGLQSLNVWRRGSSSRICPTLRMRTLVGSSPSLTMNRGGRCRMPTRCGDSRLPPLPSRAERGPRRARLSVNSSHHQAIDRPGEQLVVAAVSPEDGVIEALEGAEPQQFVVAVQWHPERSYESSEASRALFAAFLDAARSWKPSRAHRSRWPVVSSLHERFRR